MDRTSTIVNLNQGQGVVDHTKPTSPFVEGLGNLALAGLTSILTPTERSETNRNQGRALAAAPRSLAM